MASYNVLRMLATQILLVDAREVRDQHLSSSRTYEYGQDIVKWVRHKRAPFIAREEELREMHKVLHGHKTRSIVVLHGLGGMGKTQLAIEYTTRHTREYSATFWLNANDADSLSQSLQGIVRQILKIHPSTIELTRIDFDADLGQIFRAVIAWLVLPGNTRIAEGVPEVDVNKAMVLVTTKGQDKYRSRIRKGAKWVDTLFDELNGCGWQNRASEFMTALYVSI